MYTLQFTNENVSKLFVAYYIKSTDKMEVLTKMQRMYNLADCRTTLDCTSVLSLTDITHLPSGAELDNDYCCNTKGIYIRTVFNE